ncbi:MAG: hypothetical protein DRI57_19325, partial [Deltaproteobacteria bacterium]
MKQLDKAQASQDISAQMNFLTAQGMIPGGPLNMKGGDDDNIGNLSYFDIRARFYYTATIHDNFRIITNSKATPFPCKPPAVNAPGRKFLCRQKNQEPALQHQRFIHGL